MCAVTMRNKSSGIRSQSVYYEPDRRIVLYQRLTIPNHLTMEKPKNKEKSKRKSMLDMIIESVENGGKISLRDCSLSGEILSGLLKRLASSKISKLEVLDVSQNPDIGEIGVLALVRFIKQVHVVELNVHACKVDRFVDQFNEAIAEMPAQFGTIVKFTSDNNTGKFHVTPVGKQCNVGKCSLFIPPGAVQSPTDIELSIKSGPAHLPTGMLPVTPMVRCLPSGLNFHVSATLRLPTWCALGTGKKYLPLALFSRENEKENWAKDADVIYSGGGFVEVKINHFSDDVVGADEDATMIYKLLVFRKESCQMQDDHSIVAYCIKDENFLFEKVTCDCYRTGYNAVFPPITVRVRSGQEISLNITAQDNGVSLRNGHSQWTIVQGDCGVEESKRVCQINCVLPNQRKKEGLYLKLEVKLDGRLAADDPQIKVFWTDDSSRNIINFYNNTNFITSPTIENIILPSVCEIK